MPIRHVRADIVAFPAAALVNPVNCVGVAGRGLALRFRRARPDNHAAYVRACRDGRLAPGRAHVHSAPPRPAIVNFPTKRHWRNPSRLDDIATGLDHLRLLLDEHRWPSIAIPPLGCGLGGLAWDAVRPLIADAFDRADADVVLCSLPRPTPVP